MTKEELLPHIFEYVQNFPGEKTLDIQFNLNILIKIKYKSAMSLLTHIDSCLRTLEDENLIYPILELGAFDCSGNYKWYASTLNSLWECHVYRSRW